MGHPKIPTDAPAALYVKSEPRLFDANGTERPLHGVVNRGPNGPEETLVFPVGKNGEGRGQGPEERDKEDEARRRGHGSWGVLC